MSVRDARVYTCKRVLYTISYRVQYTFTKLHDRRIPNIGVGVRVGPVECQLYRSEFDADKSPCAECQLDALENFCLKGTFQRDLLLNYHSYNKYNSKLEG